MKLFKKIKRFFCEELCLPSDFYWLTWDTVKETKRNYKYNIMLFMAALVVYLFYATIFLIGYYLTLPFVLLHKWCEEWRYR